MNIKQPVNKALFNTINADDFVVFTDTVEAMKKLLIPKLGMEIPEKGTIKSVTETDIGLNKSVNVELTRMPFAQGIPTEYGLTFMKNIKSPGVLNADFHPFHQFYGDRLHYLHPLENGLLADKDGLEMEDHIITGATKDPGAYVQLKRAYVITELDPTASSGIDITLPDGSVVSFKTSKGNADGDEDAEGAFASGNFGTQFNNTGTLIGKLICYRIGQDKYYITSVDPGYLFTISLTDTPTCSVGHRFIRCESITPDVLFNVQYDEGFATQYNDHSYTIDTTTFDNTKFIHTWVEGLNHEIAVASFISLASNINTALSGHGVWASRQTTTKKVFVHDNGDVEKFVMTIDDNTLLKMVKSTSPEGRFPALTSDDIFREFSFLPSHGEMSQMMYRVNQPIKGAKYKKYTFTVSSKVASLSEGASHFNTMSIVYHIYVEKTASTAFDTILAGMTFTA